MNLFRRAIALWKQGQKSKGAHLHRRLFIFFAMSGAAVIALFVCLLLLFDITGSGALEVRQFAQNELTHVSKDLETNFGNLSVQGVSFGDTVGRDVDVFFAEHNITPFQLKGRPEFILPLLAEQIKTMKGVMEHTPCSGVFLLLDATVNPALEDARYSRAGIFLKKIEPNAISAVGSDIHYLRGPADLARANGIDLMGQWRMEFDIREEAFFDDVMETARENPTLPLSRLYFWSPRVTLEENSEAGMLLCVPLQSKDGQVLGVCGLEVSDRLFKQLYSPDNSTYTNAFSALAPADGPLLHAEEGMLAGNSYLTSAHLSEPLTVLDGKKGFSLYQSSENAYGGVHTGVKLYPADSPYGAQSWMVAVMMEEDTLRDAILGSTPYLLLIAALLLFFSLGASVYISRRYLRPVTEGLSAIKAKNYRGSCKNTYVEINDLMEFLAQQDEEEKNRTVHASQSGDEPRARFEAFLQQIKTLSPAEKSVFDLYVKGRHAQEIADELCLSINTIKTHNRRIFAKLDVSTRKELLVYLDMMKELDMIKEE